MQWQKKNDPLSTAAPSRSHADSLNTLAHHLPTPTARMQAETAVPFEEEVGDARFWQLIPKLTNTARSQFSS